MYRYCMLYTGTCNRKLAVLQNAHDHLVLHEYVIYNVTCILCVRNWWLTNESMRNCVGLC